MCLWLARNKNDQRWLDLTDSIKNLRDMQTDPDIYIFVKKIVAYVIWKLSHGSSYAINIKFIQAVCLYNDKINGWVGQTLAEII